MRCHVCGLGSRTIPPQASLRKLRGLMGMDLNCIYFTWFHLIWFDLIWFDLIWFDLISWQPPPNYHHSLLSKVSNSRSSASFLVSLLAFCLRQQGRGTWIRNWNWFRGFEVSSIFVPHFRGDSGESISATALYWTEYSTVRYCTVLHCTAPHH